MSDALLRRLLWVGLVVLLCLVYLPVLDAPFVYDDKIEVVGNATIRNLDEWRAIARYNVARPLLVLSYAVDFDRNALSPPGYHISNLVIAGLALGAALLLVEAVLRLARVTLPLKRAGVVVLLWAVHPMATEGITYITGRSESLCALFCFLSLGAWARAMLAEREGGSGVAWRLLGLVAFVGAVSSKEVGAVVPAAAVALELLLGPGRGLGERLRQVRWAWLLPTAVLIAVAILLRFQHAESLLPKEVDRPLGVQLVTQCEAWLHYLRLWLLPWGQTIFHHLEDVQPLSLRGVVAVAGWAVVVGLGVLWGRRVPAAAFALMAAALFLAPSSSLVPLKENMAEHRAFQTGLWLLLALAASIPAGRARLAGWVALPVAAGLVALTQLRHQAWSSEIALWEEAVQRSPEVAEAWYGLGDARRFASEFTAAAEAYERTVELDAGHLDAWNNLGITRASTGDIARARQAWESALRLSPTYCKAHSNLGMAAFGQRDWVAASGEFTTALAYCPENPTAHLGLCRLYYGPQRDRERATFHCDAFVKLAPFSDQTPKVKEWLLELTF